MSVYNRLSNLFKNHKVVSLGYSCIPKLVLRKIQKHETQLFDWVGTTLLGIYDIIKSDFPVLTNEDDLILYQTEKSKNLIVVTHKKYFIRYLHDFPVIKNKNIQIKIPNDFQEKYNRRINRFQKLLTSDQKIIVSLHYEDNSDERYETLYDDIKPFYPARKENYHLEQHEISFKYAKNIVELLRNKYQKELYIIYLTRFNKTQYIDTHNIIMLNMNIDFVTYKDKDLSKLAILKSLDDNYDLINKIINPSPSN